MAWTRLIVDWLHLEGNTMGRFAAKIYLSLMLALMLGVVGGCGADDNATMTTDSALAETGATSAAAEGRAANGKVARVGSNIGDIAPDFTLKRLSGKNLSLSEFRGKTVLVDFWDTWCPPCRRAMPHLQELSEIYENDLVVIGVAFGREGQAKVETYVSKNNLTFEMVIFNESSPILSDFGGIQSLPTTFLIDADGVIRNRWVGAADKKTYEKAVVAAINPSS